MGSVEVDRPCSLVRPGAAWCGLVWAIFAGSDTSRLCTAIRRPPSTWIREFIRKLEVILKNSCRTEAFQETLDNCNGTTHHR